MTRATAATPACLLGMLLRMAYKAKKYHSGTMCAGVVSGLAWIELSGWPRAIGVPKATRATPMAHTTQPTRPRRGPMLMRGYCQSENKPGFDECRDAGTRAGIEGGIRRPHQKEGENIASSEKAGKVHKGITDSERQPRCDGGKTCAKAFVQAIRPRCRVMGQTCTANPNRMKIEYTS